ncbi:MAG TPA: tetratricopeptide repeat protein, partial [Pirellulales bacterium]
APVLLQLRRAEDALPLLKSILEKKPGDLFGYINLAQAYVQLSQYEEAVKVVQAMKDVQPENAQARLEMGERLIAPEDRNVAIAVFQQILDRDPQNREAKVAMAEVYLTTFEPQLAWPLLIESYSDKPYKPHTMAIAEYHLLIGEYADALLVYRNLTQFYPDAPDVFIALGDLYHADSVTEMDTARLQYEKALQLDPKNRVAKIKLARNYASQRSFLESNEICRELIAANPHETEAYRVLGENLIKLGEIVEVEQLIEARRLLGTRDRLELAELRLATGRLLYLMGKPLNAIHEFQAAAGMPGGMKAETAYGLYACLMALENPPKAEQTLLTSMAMAGPQTYVRMIIGNLALQDCNFKLASRMFGEIYKYTPNNIRAGVRLGISLTGARMDPTREDAIGTFQDVLAKSPSNIQGRLELARLLNAETSFKESVREYDVLIKQMPSMSMAYREKARVLTSWKGYDGADWAYGQAIGMAAKGETVPPVALPGTDGVPAPSAIPEVEISGMQAEIISTEAQGKSLKGWRGFYAAQAFEGLTAIEPYEGDGYFELAQAYAGLNQTHDAMEVYEDLLSLNPCHREACIALRRSYLETRPQ